MIAPDAEVMQAAKDVSGGFARRFESRARKMLEGHHLAVFLDLPSWTTEIEQFLSLGEMFSQMGAAATTFDAVADALEMLYPDLFVVKTTESTVGSDTEVAPANVGDGPFEGAETAPPKYKIFSTNATSPKQANQKTVQTVLSG